MTTQSIEQAAEEYVYRNWNRINGHEAKTECFKVGVAWRDKNPSEEVKGLVEALEQIKNIDSHKHSRSAAERVSICKSALQAFEGVLADSEKAGGGWR